MVQKIRFRLAQFRKLLTADSRTNGLEAHLTRVQGELESLRLELDALRSNLEVPQELIREFRDWKVTHPISARPLVSVCVATYNRSRLLTERCIPSILGQTYTNLELIVVGDGCTDDTGSRVSEIKDERFTFLNLPKRGNYPTDKLRRWMVAGTPAINKAISMARGDYLTHLDDDDEYLAERLERLVDFAATHKCDFVWHPFWVEDSSGHFHLEEAREFKRGNVTTSSVFYRQWFKKIEWNIDAHWLYEPGDWNRFRRIRHIGPVSMRYPEPLLRHYKERTQHI